MIGPEEDLPTLIHNSDHLGILRYARANRLRDPNLVIKHGLAYLGPDIQEKNKKKSSVVCSSEHLAALEQVCRAALDIQDHDLAECCLSEIRSSSSSSASNIISPDSARSRRLLGLCLESANDHRTASQIYNDLSKENPMNAFALKRKYSILKSQRGKEVEARSALNAYLERNSDASGWYEMSKLCRDMGDYGAAIYACEEVMLTSPLDADLHCLLGELYGTAGGMDNLRLGRKHLCESLELRGPERNLRALYGLVSVSMSYLEEVGKSGKSKRQIEEHDVEVAIELVKFGGEKLMNYYGHKERGGYLKTVIDKVMKDFVSASNAL